MKNESIEMTTTTTTTETTVKAQAPRTNGEIRQHMASSALDFLTIKEEAHKAALLANPALDVETASRRAKLGALGMAAETHSRCNGLLAGMADRQMKVIKQMGINAEKLAKDPKAGGFSREHKFYVPTIAECIVQDKRPADIDLTKANEALQELDPTASVKRTGHNTISLLIDVLKTKDRFSLGFWSHECNGPTQGAYIFGFLVKTGMATETGSKDARTVTIKTDHPVIVALKAIK